MSFPLNLLYLLALLLLSPWLIYKALTTGKYRSGLGAKLLGLVPDLSKEPRNAPLVWFHGVSVGEIHLLRQVIKAFRERHPEWQCVVSTTTDTGMAEAKKHFHDLSVVWFPFDFSWSVKRALRRLRPDLVVISEGELWPNFLRAAKKRGCKVAIINGRMSDHSARRHQKLRWLTAPLWKCIDLLAVQSQEYADHFHALGVPREKLFVTGSVKYDGVTSHRNSPLTEELRRWLKLKDEETLWVAGSTQAPEERIALDIYEKLKPIHPELRLVLVPRQKERFEEVASLLRQRNVPHVLRSDSVKSLKTPSETVVLLDTIGELGALWPLADIAFVGGSLDGKRGGQNMIEPAAHKAAVVFGPHVWNFRDPSRRLLEAGAALQVKDAEELSEAIRQLLESPERQRELGERARKLVLRQQGATRLTLEVLDRLLTSEPFRRAA